MANRRFEQFGGTLERKVVKLFAKVLYAGGVPTLVDTAVLNTGTSPVTINESQGIESLVPGTGPGAFVLYLGNNNGGVPEYDSYVRLLNVSVCANFVNAATYQGFGVILGTVDVQGNSGNPSIEMGPLRYATATGIVSVGAPDDGTELLIEITLSNTTAY